MSLQPLLLQLQRLLGAPASKLPHTANRVLLEHDSKFTDQDLDCGWDALSARRASEFELLLNMHSLHNHADALSILLQKFNQHATQAGLRESGAILTVLFELSHSSADVMLPDVQQFKHAARPSDFATRAMPATVLGAAVNSAKLWSGAHADSTPRSTSSDGWQSSHLSVELFDNAPAPTKAASAPPSTSIFHPSNTTTPAAVVESHRHSVAYPTCHPSFSTLRHVDADSVATTRQTAQKDDTTTLFGALSHSRLSLVESNRFQFNLSLPELPPLPTDMSNVWNDHASISSIFSTSLGTAPQTDQGDALDMLSFASLRGGSSMSQLDPAHVLSSHRVEQMSHRSGLSMNHLPWLPATKSYATAQPPQPPSTHTATHPADRSQRMTDPLTVSALASTVSGPLTSLPAFSFPTKSEEPDRTLLQRATGTNVLPSQCQTLHHEWLKLKSNWVDHKPNPMLQEWSQAANTVAPRLLSWDDESTAATAQAHFPNSYQSPSTNPVLIRQALLALQGIPSALFYWNPLKRRFDINSSEAVRCLGDSTMALLALLRQVAAHGSNYRRLYEFIASILNSEFESSSQHAYGMVCQSFAAGLQTLLQQYCDFIVRLPTQCEVEPVSSVQHANSAAPPITSPSLSHMMDALARFKARNQLHKNTFHYDTASQMGSPTPISPSSVSHSASAARLPSASSSANRFSPASPATSASPSSLSVFAARSPAQLPNQDTHKEAKELREPARVEKVPPASRGRVRSRISRNIASFGAAASQSDAIEPLFTPTSHDLSHSRVRFAPFSASPETSRIETVTSPDSSPLKARTDKESASNAAEQIEPGAPPKAVETCPMSLLNLVHRMAAMGSKLAALCNMCHLTSPLDSEFVCLPFPVEFPRGGALLSYLYRYCMLTAVTDAAPLVRYLFQCALQPYMHMLDAWLYQGVLVDPHCEFMIIVAGLDPNSQVPTFDLAKPASALESTPTLDSLPAMPREVPTFLQNHSLQILQGGQTAAVLRLGSSKHFTICALGVSQAATEVVSAKLTPCWWHPAAISWEQSSTYFTPSQSDSPMWSPLQLRFTFASLFRSESDTRTRLSAQQLLLSTLIEETEQKLQTEKATALQRVSSDRSEIRQALIDAETKMRAQREAERQKQREYLIQLQIAANQAAAAKRIALQQAQQLAREQMDAREIARAASEVMARRMLEERYANLKAVQDAALRRLQWREDRMKLNKTRQRLLAEAVYIELDDDIQQRKAEREKLRQEISTQSPLSSEPADEAIDVDTEPEVSIEPDRAAIAAAEADAFFDLSRVPLVSSRQPSRLNSPVAKKSTAEPVEPQTPVESETRIVPAEATITEESIMTPDFLQPEVPTELDIDTIGDFAVEALSPLNVIEPTPIAELLAAEKKTQQRDTSVADALNLEQLMGKHRFDQHLLLPHDLNAVPGAESDENSTLVVNDVRTALSASISSRVDAQTRMAHSVALQLMRQMHLDAHLKALQFYVLMQAGDVMDSFARSLFDSLPLRPAYRVGVDSNQSDDRLFALRMHARLLSADALETTFKGSIAQLGYEMDQFSNRIHFSVQPATSTQPSNSVVSAVQPSEAVTTNSITLLIPLSESLHSLDHINIHYRIDWPLNLVLTDESMAGYQRLFSFFLRVKRVAHELNDLWMLLQQTTSFMRRQLVRRDMKARPYSSERPAEFITLKVPNFRNGSVAQWNHVRGVWLWRARQLHLYRHEMQHVITVFQSYLITQVLQVCWHELEQPLKNASSWPELANLHSQYVSRALFRCFLDSKMAPVMKVLDNLFALILEFKQHSLSLDLMDLIDEFDAEATFSAAVHSLSPKPGSILKRISPALQHSARMSSSLFDAASERDREQSFSQLQTSMQRFRQHADFLYRVLRQLGARGFQTALLRELQMRLDFNGHYAARHDSAQDPTFGIQSFSIRDNFPPNEPDELDEPEEPAPVAQRKPQPLRVQALQKLIQAPIVSTRLVPSKASAASVPAAVAPVRPASPISFPDAVVNDDITVDVEPEDDQFDDEPHSPTHTNSADLVATAALSAQRLRIRELLARAAATPSTPLYSPLTLRTSRIGDEVDDTTELHHRFQASLDAVEPAVASEVASGDLPDDDESTARLTQRWLQRVQRRHTMEQDEFDQVADQVPPVTRREIPRTPLHK